MSTTTVDVDGYAAAVRAALAGLGPEQIEDLTDGLEANLSDALADEGRVVAGRTAVDVFGPASEYAAELLAAAGIADPPPARRRRTAGEVLDAPFQALGRWSRRRLESLRKRRWWPAVEDFLQALRPAWWMLRAWVLWRLVAALGVDAGLHLLPQTPLGVLVLVALVVGSVQWGRGRWRTAGAGHRLLLAVSALAVVAAVPVLVSVSGGVTTTATEVVTVSAPVTDGVVAGGHTATNLFVYDGAGNPVAQAQVYDQDGRPVRTLREDYGGFSDAGTWYAFAPATSGGQSRWNVYPLLSAPMSQWTTDEQGRNVLLPGSEPTTPWPFALAPAVVVATAPAPGPSGSAAATPAPSSTTAPGGATGEPTASVSPVPGPTG